MECLATGKLIGKVEEVEEVEQVELVILLCILVKNRAQKTLEMYTGRNSLNSKRTGYTCMTFPRPTPPVYECTSVRVYE